MVGQWCVGVCVEEQFVVYWIVGGQMFVIGWEGIWECFVDVFGDWCQVVVGGVGYGVLFVDYQWYVVEVCSQVVWVGDIVIQVEYVDWFQLVDYLQCLEQ